MLKDFMFKQFTFSEQRKKKGLESNYLITHCVTFVQSEIGTKAIHSDVLERSKNGDERQGL